ncbi:hypothetical protein [Mesorhizobium sp.]|uniref:hypothetical protein n=1 Tax=Mesorhizobium sp. TaxID=1871066 RepID=UPI001215BBBD|nr:hypothetical protein [Mesorhizobium sp.]TIN11635.1 MAG: class I SAM-dependent methyltransferase [Mesorhizobium sp.]
MSLMVRAFGSFSARVAFDLVSRRPYAFGVLEGAQIAKRFGYSGRLLALEFGVAGGDGLFNLARIAKEASAITGQDIQVVGFDSGQGLPASLDYRDHPELYKAGDYPPIDKDRLIAALPANCKLIYGDIAETALPFLSSLEDTAVSFVSIDVDYYSSATDCLRAIGGATREALLPYLPIYFDDTLKPSHCSWAGERLSVREFNEQNPMRKIEPYTGLRGRRIMKRARWIDQMYALHTLDHPLRTVVAANNVDIKKLSNRYL